MAQIVKEISVDVAKRNLFQAIVAKQHDSNSRFLKVTLTNEDEKILVDTTSVATINACRADGSASAFAGTVNSDGTVTVPLTNWMLELDDTVKCDITVIDAESRKLTSTSFELEVETAAYGGSEIKDDEDYDLLVTLLSDYEQLEKRVENLEQNGGGGGSDSSQNGNAAGTGLSADLKSALTNFFTNVQTLIPQLSFVSPVNAGIIVISNAQAVVTALGGSNTEPGVGNDDTETEKTVYTIIRSLVGCTSTSSVVSVEKGKSHEETLLPNSGYTLTGATVSVTMGGNDISSKYSDGNLKIDSVDGDIIISASAVQVANESDVGCVNFTGDQVQWGYYASNAGEPTNLSYNEGFVDVLGFSDYLPVGGTYVFTNDSHSGISKYMYCYDANKQYIGYAELDALATYPDVEDAYYSGIAFRIGNALDGTKYIRFNVNKQGKNDYRLYYRID